MDVLSLGVDGWAGMFADFRLAPELEHARGVRRRERLQAKPSALQGRHDERDHDSKVTPR